MLLGPEPSQPRSRSMSADNTIGILITRRRDGNAGNEYRVAHVQSIENMEYEPLDYPSVDHPLLNREWVRRLFGKSPVFLDLEDAFRLAKRLEKEAEYVEYGIRLLDFNQLYFPASDRKRQRRHFGRRYQQTQTC